MSTYRVPKCGRHFVKFDDVTIYPVLVVARTASGPKSNFIWDNIPTKAILFFFGCSEVNSTWLITSELANQRTRKVLFTCVVYSNEYYYMAG